MTHWLILPIVLPAMLAAFMVLAARYHLLIQRVLSVTGTLGLLALALGLFWQASDGTVSLYQLGNWAAPFGIVLVADRLSTLMVLLTCVLAVPVLLYAIGSGWDNRGRHFHPLFQFQLMGILGAFLTGDAFNLFVFFEVLLIASYGLMIHAGGQRRLRAGTQYVLYNLLGSTLFLFALGTIYAETGTLNMADLAMRVATLDAGDGAGIRVAAVLLLLVFAVKAAILPLHFWLPASYSEAPAPVAALFAIMTKVGAYCIIRFYTLVFPPDLEITQGLFDVWLMPAALLTVALGMAGVLGAKRADRMVAFSVIGSMGMLLAAVSVFTPAGISAALYYAIHSTFAAAALFLLIDVIRSRRGAAEVSFVDAPPLAGGALVAGMFFVAAIAMTGLPPLSGFLGKLLILDAARSADLMWWVWGVILVGSLIAVVGFSRAGSQIFWKAHQSTPEPAEGDEAPVVAEGQGVLPMVAIGGLLALLVALTVAAGPMTRVLNATAAQLFNPERYLAVVLTTPGKEITDHHAEDDHGDAEGSADATEDHGAEDAAAPEKDH
ncbi:Na(+)/H(+) antiporter subunit D [Sulfitobacter pontiacus]|jgi:multicomponent K+:H+ antiporter subunit D|uniref:Na(+)/H(+) antiporter subunit D n=1 Tax=Sulfitobacter pontiacus TaxID=60137 RepID=A0AAX3ADN8_9RHOB|nr:monovalent cation/H+ antiporter subunit D [Sulfitobacter pontiacus]UOA23315.1 Na(+)/H(+) antiporter subunit D [Sulfitobacter pontiacus]WPZ24295.1 monovalent cation/H+ antiporter subunit D [Sulfitobacter pontiacus]